jgi:hypothetical protein
MEINTAKKLLDNNFFDSLQHKIPEGVQNDPDFQVYACDALNELVLAAKEIDQIYEGRRVSGVSPFEIVETDDTQSYMDTLKTFFKEDYWEDNFEKVEEFIINNNELVNSQPSISSALFIRAVEVAKTDSLKLLFKISTII